MGFRASDDTILINQRCVLYYEIGQTEDLATIFRIQGIGDDRDPVTAEDIEAQGMNVGAEWGVKNPERKTCYVCSNPQPSDRLCPCYFRLQISVSNIPEVVNNYPDHMRVLNYLCSTCREDAHVEAFVIKKTNKRQRIDPNVTFRSPTYCQGCYTSKQPKGSKRQPAKAFAPKLQERVSAPTLEELKQSVASQTPNVTS